MSYCLNPDCQRAESNPVGAKLCQTCGSKLLLQERYRVLKLIGQGGFGRTFLAVDEAHPSKLRCVIKQFFPQALGIANIQKAAELFEQEAVRLETLGKHPQIPQFLAHFEQDNRQYLIQEFIDGANLAQVLEAEGAFSEAQIRDLLNSLLPVIEFIHAHNVIHRDIKPENIIRRIPPSPPLVKGDVEGVGGELVLVDFGAAKYATGTALVRTGTAIGSAGYAAPEQAGGKAIFSSDLYSLGVTCLHLLTGIEPFDLYSYSEAAWVWREYLSRPVSRQLRLVLDMMVEMATSRRYQSASEVLSDLNSPITSRRRTSRAASANYSVQSPQTAFPKVTPASKRPIPSWRWVDTLKGHTNSIRAIAISPDGQILASGSDDKTIKLWQLATGQELLTLRGHTKPVYSVAISPDGQILASGSDDKTIKLWNLSTGWQFGTITLGNWFSGSSCGAYEVAFSPDGQTLASLSSGGTVKLWNLKTGREIQTLTDGTSWVHAIAISPNGRILAGGSDDSTIQLWSLRTGRRLHTLKGHTSWVPAVAFSPDGQMLASGGDDMTIKVWNLKTKRELCVLRGHTQPIYSLAFSPICDRAQRKNENYSPPASPASPAPPAPSTRQLLASSSDDSTIKLWDVSKGQELCTLRGHTSWVHAVAFNPDGRILVSGGGDSIINIWQED